MKLGTIINQGDHYILKFRYQIIFIKNIIVYNIIHYIQKQYIYIIFMLCLYYHCNK